MHEKNIVTNLLPTKRLPYSSKKIKLAKVYFRWYWKDIFIVDLYYLCSGQVPCENCLLFSNNIANFLENGFLRSLYVQKKRKKMFVSWSVALYKSAVNMKFHALFRNVQKGKKQASCTCKDDALPISTYLFLPLSSPSPSSLLRLLAVWRANHHLWLQFPWLKNSHT